ncbi:hypothetical protein ACRC7T_13820 [Segnochrobactraceae bacterium EtOH-i3]
MTSPLYWPNVAGRSLLEQVNAEATALTDARAAAEAAAGLAQAAAGAAAQSAAEMPEFRAALAGAAADGGAGMVGHDPEADYPDDTVGRRINVIQAPATPHEFGAAPQGDYATQTGPSSSGGINAMLAACAGRRSMRFPAGVYSLDSTLFYGGSGHIDITFEAGAVLMPSVDWVSTQPHLMAIHSYGPVSTSYNGTGGDPAARQIVHIAGPGRFDCRRLQRQGTGVGSAGLNIAGRSIQYAHVEGVEFFASRFDSNGEPVYWRYSDLPGGDTGIGIMGCSNIHLDNLRMFGFPDAGAYLGGDFEEAGERLNIINCLTDMTNFGLTVKRNFRRANISGNRVERGVVGISLLYASVTGGNAGPAQAQILSNNAADHVQQAFWLECQTGISAVGNRATNLGRGAYDNNADALVSMFTLTGCQDCDFESNVAYNVQSIRPTHTLNNSEAFAFATLGTFSQAINGATLTRHSTGNRIHGGRVDGLHAGVVEADANQDGNVYDGIRMAGVTRPYLLKGPASQAWEIGR